MAPEQARGEPPTPATDVWALGVVLHRCLTGELPFQGSSDAELLYKIGRERAPRLATIAARQVPHKLALVLDRALEQTVERRYPDMRSFAQAIAVACALEHVPLPQRPEPIGLPRFERWFADAQAIECTRDLDPPCEPSLVRAEHAERAVRRGRKPALAGVICAIVGASALFAFVPGDRAGHADMSPHGSPAGQPGTRRVSAREVAAAPTSLPSPPIGRVLPSPADLGPSPAPSIAGPRPRKRNGGRTEERPSTSAAPAPPPLLTDWDWQ